MVLALWTQTLLSAAEISNFLSVLGVMICFFCMVIFIFRAQGMNFSSGSVVHVGQAAPVQVDFRKIGVPFICSLNKKDSHDHDLELKIIYDVHCVFQALWYVPSSTLKEFLYLPWQNFFDKLENIETLNAKEVEEQRLLVAPRSNEAHIIKLTKKSDVGSLGKAPRTHFPLVVILKRKEIPYDSDSNVGALVTIFHISDEDCPMPTTILYQYLKQYSGQLTQLQNLYTQKSELPAPDLNSEQMSSCNFEREGVEDEACVICRVNRATRALLPCRHVCACATCFPHLEVCPLCRCRIAAFFLTDPREEERQRESGEDDRREEGVGLNRHRSFINNMNNVLNSILGLREE